MAESPFPESYKDPLYARLDSANEQKLGLPAGLLSGIRTNGERTNASQVSSAKAKTPYQFIPATREAIIQKWGIDPYLSPQNASEAAGLLLKESLDRNNGDPAAAAGEYHAGPDRKNWGPITDAYIKRVTGSVDSAKTDGLEKGFAAYMAANPAVPPAAKPAAPTDDPLAAGFGSWMQATNGGKNLTPASQIPTSQVAGVPDAIPAPTEPLPDPNAPKPGVMDQIIGAGETALNVGTAATGGTLGAVGGLVHGIAGAVLNGDFGTPQAADRVDQQMAQGAQALTYAPRTPAGQSQAAAVGGVLQNLTPVLPMTAEMGAIGAAASPALRQAAGAVRREPTPVAPVEAAPMAAADLAQTAKTAADGSKKATQILAEQASPDPQTVASGERLGISDYLQPDHVTTSDAYRQVVGTIKSNPQSAVALAEKEGLGKVAQRASELIDEIGGTNDLSQLHDSVKGRMQATHEAMSAKEDALYDKLREAIPAKTEAPAPNVLDFIAKRADELGGEEHLSPLEKSVVAKLAPKGEDPLEGMGPSARAQMEAQGVTGPKQPTYALLDDVRRDIGSATKQRGAFKDADSGLAKQLYGEISKDQEAAVQKVGLSGTFDAARSATVLRKGFEDDLSSLFGKNLDRSFVASGDSGLPGAVRSLAAGDSSRLVKLVQAVPEDLRQSVVASGLGTVFRKSATRGEMDFTGYSKFMDGLTRNRQAYAALMTNLPLSARKQLMALYHVSKGISDSLQTRVKTGALNTIKAEMMGTDNLMSNLFTMAKKVGIKAAASEVATSTIGLPGVGLASALSSALTKGKTKPLVAVDSLLASQEFAQLAKTASGTPARTTAVRRLAASPAFSKVLRKIGEPMTLGERERWIARSLASPNASQPNDRRARTLH